MTASLTATVKGGLFANYSTTLAGIRADDSSGLRKWANFYLNRRGGLALKKLAVTLNGAAAGSSASKAIGRIEANSELGGKRVVESLSLVNRNTAAADVTALNAAVFDDIEYTVAASVIANGDGNPLGIAH